MSSCSTAKKTLSQPEKILAAKFSLKKLKPLDYILLVIMSCFIGWLYYRSSVGINYHWQWHKAFDLVFTPGQNGELPYFFQGIISTIRLSLWGMLFAAVFGLLLALGRRSSFIFFRLPANAYIQLVRNIPPLVFVFIFYFFISSQLVPLLGLDNLFRNYHGNENLLQDILFGNSQLWENLFSGILCVGLIAAAYIAEVIRSGLDAIDKGQWEATSSLGLSRLDGFRFVIFPQAIAGIVPALAGQFISIVKDSSIISLISIQEITFVGSEMANSSGLIFEIWLLVGAVYLILCLSLSLLFTQLEKRSLRHLQR
ncbi:amino acid ABC transporter permease [Photobacterium sp. GB-27]|uniref:amino acid ABC transporter permease n=1 Tax=unclassified Photobacterium TaxID=2628852 RepID=UPI000D1513BC|nr:MULTISPECIES: amino acid ABC transporter permease [unclassified Photobacterium]PSV25413.1 amino acid ABC transporter permease [Photobacterium sp. GB-56]PSV30082.1 amino acid ABC transporter permease [Photobacterium sp. GB-72]PSV34036.1 amino acid ABC transporter permease [Photobacterium sp. GB-27]PSV38066.1 amino acid ABC transporter permease [Photobacterium sp. GB-210]PSV41327.1 amino acid ABC transporter permease [Photobacterium sp. GB-36]